MNDEELWRGFAQVLRTRPVIGVLGAAILILASLKVMNFLPPLHNTAVRGKPTVDISFSLECRDLEGVPNERLVIERSFTLRAFLHRQRSTHQANQSSDETSA